MLAHEHLAYGGWWIFAPLFWIGAWILVIALFRGLFWRRHRHFRAAAWASHHGGWNHGGDSDPRVILAQRYAKGEINDQEYQDRLRVLNTPLK
ncbi:putative membrane protein [Allocatelliglobosispora scoriae]|uniref:Putative membrane protein n=1 Tax=Allocatelliglobosispora scoriae TaxID=643052 RepID=A0A841BZM7_9ACTN|nr:SHOCT domain-containing protein [Allocatelliglobosispora scoriae]MBB5872111.1 putative membrane protein [Allocatelliglobosispora scoriae]